MRNLFIVAILLTTICDVFAQENKSRYRVEDFFPARPGLTWNYDCFEPNPQTGESRYSDVQCLGVYQEGNAMKIITRIITIVNTTNNHLHAISNNMVFLEKTESMFGVRDFQDKKIIMKLPQYGSSCSWTNVIKDRTPSGSCTTIEKCQAKFINPEVLLITVKTTTDVKEFPNSIEKNYYKKNVGLVRCEFFMESTRTKKKDKKPNGILSYKLVD